MAASELNFLMEDVSKELAAVHDSLRRKHVEFIPVLKTERHKITYTLNEMKDSLGSQLDVIDKNLIEEQARCTVEEITRLRDRSSCLRDCRELLDKFSTVEASMEEMRILLDQNTLKCSETIAFASSILPRLEEMTSMKGEVTEESTMAITRILYARVADFRDLLIGKLNSWFKQALVFPPTRVASITQMHVCVGDTTEASMNLTAMSNLQVLNDWLVKLADNIMKNIVHHIINGDGFSVVSTTTDPVKSNLYILRVKASKGKKTGETNVDEIFNQLMSIFTHLNSSLIGVEINYNPFSTLLMKILMPQLQMAILKNVISPRSTSDSIEEIMKKAEAFREQLIDIGMINDVTPSFNKFAENHEKVFTDRKCITRLARARELILMQYVDLTTVGYGEEHNDEDKFDEDSLAALGIRGKEASDDSDKCYPFFFRLLKCKISSTTKELIDLVRETVNEATKAENEEMAGRLMLTARNMVEMFLLLTKSHATNLSSVPQMAAMYHNNCHYIGHRLMLLLFDIVNEKHAVILSSFRSFFAPFIVQLRASAQQVMNNQLLQIRRNLSTLLADSSMAAVSSIERGANACTMQITSISNVWKEVLPELVYCGAMSNIIGFFFDQLSHLMLTVEDITANDATFIATTLSTTLQQIEKLLVIRGSPMLHKECTKPYFHFKEIIFMLNASLQDIDDRWCEGVGPLAECLSVKEIRHLVKALFSNSEQRKRLLDRFY